MGKPAAAFTSVETPNLKGRDFVVSDLHGSISSLERAMGQVNFDPSCDRLFSVGDLIDRGEDSMACLSLLKQPWFYAVRGNHEDMLLSALEQYDSVVHGPMDFVHNGGRWAMDPDILYTLEEVYAPLLRALPYARMVPKTAYTPGFNLAHAELVAPVNPSFDLSEIDETNIPAREMREVRLLTDSDLHDLSSVTPKHFDEHAIRRMQAISTWGRRLIGSVRETANQDLATRVPEGVSANEAILIPTATPHEPGLSTTFVGHTIRENFALNRSHLYTDTGAYKGAPLSFIDAHRMVRWIEHRIPREAETPTKRFDFAHPRSR